MQTYKKVAALYQAKSQYGAEFLRNTPNGKLWRVSTGPGYRHFLTSDDISGKVLVFLADAKGKPTSDIEFSTGRNHDDAAENGARALRINYQIPISRKKTTV